MLSTSLVIGWALQYSTTDSAVVNKEAVECSIRYLRLKNHTIPFPDFKSFLIHRLRVPQDASLGCPVIKVMYFHLYLVKINISISNFQQVIIPEWWAAVGDQIVPTPRSVEEKE